jgi:3-dehydroquinate synthase
VRRFIALVWKNSNRFGAGRKSLIINLGGRVLRIWAVVASTFKRELTLSNVPTTLLGWLISRWRRTAWTSTRSKIRLRYFAENGSDRFVILQIASRESNAEDCEILKHGLIADENYWTNF